MSNNVSHLWTWWFFILTSLRWLTRADWLHDNYRDAALNHRPLSLFLCRPHGQPFPCCWCESGFKTNCFGSCFWGDKTHFLQVQIWKPIPTLTSSWGPTVTRGEQISPGNPWALSIFRVNITVWARKLLLLTAAIVCGVRGHQSHVFLLKLCIEFKQEQHSCGNTLLQLRRTPREKVLSSSGVMAHKLLFFLPCLSPAGLITPRAAFIHSTNNNATKHHKNANNAHLCAFISAPCCSFLLAEHMNRNRWVLKCGLYS